MLRGPRQFAVGLAAFSCLALGAYGLTHEGGLFAAFLMIIGAGASGVLGLELCGLLTKGAETTLVIAAEAPRVFSRLVQASRRAFPASAIEVDPAAMAVSVSVGISWRSFGEDVAATIEDVEGESLVSVVSRCTMPALVDYGKNRRNVDGLLAALMKDEESDGTSVG